MGNVGRLVVGSVVVIAGAVGPRARVARAQTDERAVVLAVVQRVFDGMRTKDTTLLLSAFDSTARLLGVRPRRDGAEMVQVLPVRQFASFVVSDTRGVWLERVFDPEVRIDGTLASVWAPYDFHLGGTFSHCGVDAVHLLKIAGEWKIVALTDTYQPQGCPSRPPPPRE